jgi:hypothetical protein
VELNVDFASCYDDSRPVDAAKRERIGITDGLYEFQLEGDTDDIIADIDQALDKV